MPTTPGRVRTCPHHFDSRSWPATASHRGGGRLLRKGKGREDIRFLPALEVVPWTGASVTRRFTSGSTSSVVSVGSPSAASHSTRGRFLSPFCHSRHLTAHLVGIFIRNRGLSSDSTTRWVDFLLLGWRLRDCILVRGLPSSSGGGSPFVMSSFRCPENSSKFTSLLSRHVPLVSVVLEKS